MSTDGVVNCSSRLGSSRPESFLRIYFEEKMPSLVPSAVTGEPWDALVIDEGQDFSGLWFLALQLCLADSSHSIVNVFADANQNIYRTDWEPPFEADPVMLDVNCRNTNQITERVNATIGLDSEALGADGPNPRWHHSNSAEEAVGIVLSRCQELIKSEGVEPDQLAVLATERWLIDQLRQGPWLAIRWCRPGRGRDHRRDGPHGLRGWRLRSCCCLPLESSTISTALPMSG